MCSSCRVAEATCHVWAVAAAAWCMLHWERPCWHDAVQSALLAWCLKHARSVVGGVGCLAVAPVAAEKPC
jgi:hypothetical protein